MTKRALVLGGGGPVGIAWESGLIAGLEAGGVKLADADTIVGTSAGSVVGALLALGSSGAELADNQRQQATRAPTRDVNAGAARTQAPPDLGELMRLVQQRPAEADANAARAWRAAVGTFALGAPTIGPDSFIASFGRVASTPWPGRDYRCTAIDAGTGEFKVWRQDDHVQLGAAVASSCAVPGVYPCIPIAGRRFYDGGLRSATNADVALGADVVVVVSVLTAGALAPVGSADPLAAELAALRQSGARVEAIQADAASREAFGPNLMDARRRLPALEAGLRQGEALAAQLRAHW